MNTVETIRVPMYGELTVNYWIDDNGFMQLCSVFETSTDRRLTITPDLKENIVITLRRRHTFEPLNV